MRYPLRPLKALLVAGSLAGLTACGSTEAPPAPVSPSTSAATSSAASASSTPASAAPTASPAAAASTPASRPASGSAPSSAEAAAAATKLTIVPDASQVQIRMRELLAGNAIQNDAVESSKTVSGAVTLSGGNAVAAGSTISLDLRTLAGDRRQRDQFIKGRFVLNTAQIPNAEVTITELQGLDLPLPSSGQKTFKMISDATVHGVTKPLTWDVTATFDGQTVKGEATAAFKLSDFDITVPKVGPVLQVDDAGKLVVDFQMNRSAA